MRNFNKHLIYGLDNLSVKRQLTQPEIEALLEMARVIPDETEDVYNAIVTAFYLGASAGIRQERKKNA